VLDGGGEEAGGGEDLEIPLRAPVGIGAVDDAPGLLNPGDFFEGERGAEQVLGQLLAAGGGVGGPVSCVQAEAAVGPVEELAGLLLADEFLAEEGLDEAVAEEFGEGFEGLDRKFVEAVLAVVEAGGGEDVEVGVEDEVVAEGLHGGNGGELAVR